MTTIKNTPWTVNFQWLRAPCLYSLLGAVGLVLFVYAPAHAALCGCPDTGDIQRRITIAQAAIDGYRNEMDFIARQQMRDKTIIMYTKERYAKLQGFVQEAILQKRNWSGGNTASAETTAACEIIIDPSATPCIRESLLAHEKVHQRECLANKSKLGVLGNIATGTLHWRDKKSLIDVAVEEVEGYTAELHYLSGVMASAGADCRPPPAQRAEGRDYTAIPRAATQGGPPRASPAQPQEPRFDPIDIFRQLLGR